MEQGKIQKIIKFTLENIQCCLTTSLILFHISDQISHKAILLKIDYAEAYDLRSRIMAFGFNNLNEALADSKKAIELEPNTSDFYTTRAIIYRRLSDLESAFADYNKSIELDPTNIMAYSNRAYLNGMKNLNKESIEDWNKVLQFDSTNAEAYYYRGASELSLNLNAKACADFINADRLGNKNEKFKR